MSLSDRLAISRSVVPSPMRQCAVSSAIVRRLALRRSAAPASRGTISLRGGPRASSRTRASRRVPAVRVARGPVEHRGLRTSLRRADRESRRRISHRPRRYSSPAPLAHGVGEIALEIAEERERRRRAPFLAHEQHRQHRREQRDRERGLDRLRDRPVLSSRSPSARLPIWSWFCRKLTKAVGGRLAARLAARRPPRCADASP